MDPVAEEIEEEKEKQKEQEEWQTPSERQNYSCPSFQFATNNFPDECSFEFLILNEKKPIEVW